MRSIFLVSMAVIACGCSRKSADSQPAPSSNEPALVAVAFNDDGIFPGRYVIYCPDKRDAQGRHKRLTRNGQWSGDPDDGKEPGAVMRVEDYIFTFGRIPDRPSSMNQEIPGVAKDRGWRTAWGNDFHKLQVTRDIQIVPGPTGKLDTVQISYVVEHKNSRPIKFGLLDTINSHCGDTDSVPFNIPSTNSDVADFKEFAQHEIPDVIRRFESTDPHAVSNELRPKLPGFEPPAKLVICEMPYGQVHWKTRLEPMSGEARRKDSCVVIYWPERSMNPGEQRKFGYAYGLASR